VFAKIQLQSKNSIWEKKCVKWKEKRGGNLKEKESKNLKAKRKTVNVK
jgi:hypothetical protein